jgi:hypothetical protein
MDADDSVARLELLRGLLAAEENGDNAEEHDEAPLEDDEFARLEMLRQQLQKVSVGKPALTSSSSTRIPRLSGPASNDKSSGPARPSSIGRNTKPKSLSSRKSEVMEEAATSGSESPQENSAPRFRHNSAVFERLYELHKQTKAARTSHPDDSSELFHPRINKRSERIVSETGRISLYERAVQQRFRHESALDIQERQEREDRSKARTLQTSQQLAWRRLKREIEQMFQSRVLNRATSVNPTESDSIIMALDREMFTDVLRPLNLHSIADELWLMLESGGEESCVHLNTFCKFIKDISFPENEDESLKDEFSLRVKELLIGRKAVPNVQGMEKIYREVAAETPFAPVITDRSRKLDEQRYVRMGIDPTLPRSEKIHAELRLQADRKETRKMQQSKKDLEQCTFRPRTNKIPTINVSLDSPSSTSSKRSTDAGNRLYRDSLDRRFIIQQQKATLAANRAEEEVAECTFQPRINPDRPLPTKLPPAIPSQTTFRVQALEKSVNRLKTWREKHVVREDTADIQYISRKKKEEVAAVPSPKLTTRPRNLDSSFTRQVRPVLFTADVNLPMGKTVTIEIKEGDDLARVAETFAKRNGLDKIAEAVLLRGLQEEQLDRSTVTYVADLDDEEEAPMDEEQEGDNNFMVIDVLVRPGETYELKLALEEDFIQVAYDFAADVQMDDEARDQLIQSLMQLKHDSVNYAADATDDQEGFANRY